MNDFFNVPRFIVLGGHKCGTSSLHHYLAQHPEIYLPTVKGTDYLNRVTKTIEDYQSLYTDMKTEKIAGEVSSVYLNSERACANIKRYFPNAKLIAIIRDPAERAFSNFCVLPETLNRKRNLNEIFQDEKRVLKSGLYYPQLKMYFDQLGRDKIQIYLFDLFAKNTQQFLASFFEFVEVDANFISDTSLVVRKGGKIKNESAQQILSESNLLRSAVGKLLKPFTTSEQRRILHKKAQNMLTIKEEMPVDLRKKLVNYYREDIDRVQNLLNIDLSHWLMS